MRCVDSRIRGVPSCDIDHLVVTAPSLDKGADYLRRMLGVTPQRGGEHVRMGTHNLLLRLGDTLYLEVIAANPEARAPQRPRWFGLDSLNPDSPAVLSTWVARSEDIRASAAASSVALGEITAMSRGSYRWQITVPADGCVPLDGVAPALIQWEGAGHPASRLEGCGLSLVGLRLCHPDPARVAQLLASLGLGALVSVSRIAGDVAPHLVAVIDTPLGRRELSPTVATSV